MAEGAECGDEADNQLEKTLMRFSGARLVKLRLNDVAKMQIYSPNCVKHGKNSYQPIGGMRKVFLCFISLFKEESIE